MKLLAMALAALLCPIAGAWELEAGLGPSFAHKAPNGTWWQASKELPYTMDLNSVAYKIGVKQRISDDNTLRIGYANLGRFNSDARACDRDEEYSSTTLEPLAGCNVARYIGSGFSRGIYATVDQRLPKGFSVEAGLVAYQPTFNVRVEGWKASPSSAPQTIYATNPSRIRIGAVVGASYALPDGFSIEVKEWFNKCLPSVDACVWDRTTTLMLVKEF